MIQKLRGSVLHPQEDIARKPTWKAPRKESPKAASTALLQASFAAVRKEKIASYGAATCTSFGLV